VQIHCTEKFMTVAGCRSVPVPGAAFAEMNLPDKD